MKNILKLAIAFMALFSFAACSDVPMPYEEPGTGEKTDTTTTGEKGSTKDNPLTVTEAVELITSGKAPSTEVYVKGIVTSVDYYNSQYKSLSYYISDDGKTQQLDVYSGKGLNGADFSSKSDLKVGQTVIVKGIIKSFTDKNGKTTNEIDKNSQIVSIEGDGTTTPDTPTTGEAKGSGTVSDPYNAVAATKAASALDKDGKIENVYVSGVISSIKSVSTQYGNAEFYISDDGTTEGTQFLVYRAYYLNGAKFTAEDQIKVGQKVVVKGTLVNFNGKTPEMTTGGQIVSIDGKGSGTTTPDTPVTPTTGDAMTIDNIKANKVGSVSLDTNKYGSQSVSDESTWYSWTFDGITYEGAKICISDGKNGEGLQMQGNASDASKQGFLFNKTAFSKSIKSITLVLSVASSSKYDPSFDLYAGSETHPKSTAISATPETKTSGDYKEFTYVFDLSGGDYKYFTLANDKVGALYIKSIKVTLK